MSTFRKVRPLLIAAIALVGCKPPAGHETLTPDLPNKPLACGGAVCGVYMVQRYESRSPFYERGSDGKVHQREGFRMVLEAATVRLTLTCDQDFDLPPPPACGQGMLLAGEIVWARKGSSGETLYVYNNETPQHKRIVSLWMIDSSEAK